MLTKKDRQLLIEDFKEVSVTKNEYSNTIAELIEYIHVVKDEVKTELKTELKTEILHSRDEIMNEIQNLRDDVAVVFSYRDMIENHDERIERLESKSN